MTYVKGWKRLSKLRKWLFQMLQILIWLLSPWNQYSSSCKIEPYSLKQEFDFVFCSLYWVGLLQMILSYPVCWDTGRESLLQQDKGGESREYT